MKSKIVGAFEISSTSIKLVVGQLLDNDVIVLCTLKTPLEEGSIVDGEIRDMQGVIKAISSTLKDANSKLNDPIAEYAMILPPIGFEVYDHSQETSVVSSQDIIEQIDLDNVLNQVAKAKTTNGSMIIDVIPEVFVLDKGQSFLEPPLGQRSNSLMMKAKLHVCPNHVVTTYKKAFTQANVHKAKIYVAPYTALEVIKEYQNIPADFLLIDLGARLTSVNLVGQQKLIASTFVYHGLDSISDKLASNFGIDFSVAQQLKEIFGYDDHKVEFKAPLFTVTSQDKKKRYTAEDFKDAISSMINEYIKEIANSVNEIATMYDPNIVRLPIILVGGGTKFNGISDIIKEYLNVGDLRVIVPRTIGARHPQFTNCVGAVKLLARQHIVLEEESAPVTEDSTKTRKVKMRRENFIDE